MRNPEEVGAGLMVGRGKGWLVGANTAAEGGGAPGVPVGGGL